MIDIGSASTFEEVANIKKEAYRININSGINIERILSGLYKNPTHFIFELIQNAEDAKATSIQITLEKSRLIFRHNGRPFDLRDIKGITGVDYSSKADDITQIGRFGIGFKAVFGICESPEIYSDTYNFRIVNFYVPEKIEKLPNQKIGFTYIVLPFKEDLAENVYENIEETLVNMDPDTVLFLRNIQQLDYMTNTKTGFYVRKKELKTCGQFKYYDCQIKGGQGIKSKYIFFQEEIKEGTGLYVSVAYKFDEDADTIIEESDSTKLVVFFPTERDTFLSFKINGPYQTTPTRENVPDSPENIELLNETINLYKKSLLCLKELGYVNPNFVNMLPITKRNYGYYCSSDVFYDSFHNATVQFIKENDFLPSKDGGFVSAEDCILARGPVTDLTNENDNIILFEKKKWLSTEITRDRTPKLVSFLTSILKIKEVDFDVLMSSVTEEFLRTKTTDWLKNFYVRGNNNIKTINDKYLLKKFILSESGEFVTPFRKDGVNNKVKNIYFPSKINTNKSQIVNESIIEDKEVKLFFTNIGITEMDTVESVRTQWLPDLLRSDSKQSYLEYLRLLCMEYDEQSASVQKELRDLLRSQYFIAYEDAEGNLKYTLPKNVFMAHGDSKILYEDSANAYFLLDVVDKLCQNDNNFYEFLKKIGVNHSLKTFKTNRGLTWEEKQGLLKNADYSKCEELCVDIWGLEVILKNISRTRSKVLWRALNELKDSDFLGVFEWWYYSRHNSETYKSNFVRKLQNSKWLYNYDNELVSPSEIYEEDVRSLYGGGVCLKYFEFKPNAVKLLPQEEQRKLELTKDMPLEFIEEMLEKFKEITSPKIVDVKPEENPVEIEDMDLENKRAVLSSEELVNDDANEEEVSDITTLMDQLYKDVNIPDKVIEKVVARRVSNEAEIDGELGERFVISSLKKYYEKKGCSILNDEKDSFTAVKEDKYVDVVRLNKNGKIQKGYDILVSSKDNVIAYIEVKSTKGEGREYFKVSGLQWEFAKKLNEEGKGDKHFVYTVTNVRTPGKTKIQRVKNPYQAWLDGRLEVDPVRIKY